MDSVYIRDQTSRSVQPDLKQNCPQKLLVSSSVRKQFNLFYMNFFVLLRVVKHRTGGGGGWKQKCILVLETLTSTFGNKRQ